MLILHRFLLVFLLNAAAPGVDACVSVCVCSVAAVLLLWHVDTALPLVSASGLHFCRLGRLPDSCFGIALRLLFK